MGDIYKRNTKIEESPLQQDLMLYDPEKSQFFVLNATMAYLWKNCDGAKSFDAIVAEMPASFEGVDAALASNEMQTALNELMTLGLVEPC